MTSSVRPRYVHGVCKGNITPPPSFFSEEVLLPTFLFTGQFPEGERVQEFLEPVVMGTLVFPDQYLGKLLKLCEASLKMNELEGEGCSTGQS